MALDFPAINAAALARYPGLLLELFPNGKIIGHEFRTGNLNGDAGESLSINLQTGKWSDFAGDDKGGDPISLWAAKYHLPQFEAAKKLGEILGVAAPVAPQASGEKPKWEENWPPSEIVPKPDFRHPHLKDPWRTWPYYRDLNGEPRLIGYVCRFNLPDGSKEILPLCYAKDGHGRTAWRWLSFAKPRPLYGLPELFARPGANVLIVEGEKTADAAGVLFPQAVAMTWPGGSKAVKHADWSALKGRKVVVWPDNDLPGIKAARDVAKALERVAVAVRCVVPPAGEPIGWDLADARWNPEEAAAYLAAHLVEPAGLTAAGDQPELSQPPPDDGPPLDLPEGEPLDGRAFSCLGYDHGVFFYLAHGCRQVIELTAAAHSKSNLLSIAPLQYWERVFPSKTGPNWDHAANAMIRACEKIGVYDPTRVRGRGAWWDDGNSALHLGDRIVINGKVSPIDLVKSRYVYEAASPIRASLENPLTPGEAVQFLDLCRMLAWEKPTDSLFLAGWCFIAPICGALSWRPHIWLTGPAGSGKTWVFDHILRRTLGDSALAVQSETTEAGLRQTLGNDARPVVFDEAEGEDANAQRRIQHVLGLMRQASSESGAAILKGTTTGVSLSYRIRSCFAFASIGVGVQMHADQTRVTILSLCKADLTPKASQDRFSAIQKKWIEILTPAYVERLQARAISLIPIIRQNAETFAVAGAHVIGTRRVGDQIGALLAGSYGLHSSKAISLEGATEWLEKQDWSEEAGAMEQKDETKCLAHIMEYPVRMEHGERTIGELVKLVYDLPMEGEERIKYSEAKTTLRRHGVMVEQEALLVSNSHSQIAKMLAQTAWSKNWSRILKRLPGAATSNPIRFGAGVQSRATMIPISLVSET